MTKRLDHTEEATIYSKWEASGAFKPEGDEPYFIPMPPPNITGKLHMGHALFTTLQDISIRFQRSQGKAALWLPGTDHAGLATQQKLDDLMRDQGLDPMGPEFDEFAEAYKANLSGEINQQIRRTGASCDWSRYTFTLDKSYSDAVIEALARIHSQGLLYRADNQWFIDTRGPAAELRNRMIRGELTIIPSNESKTLAHFLDNIEPWNISRQIRWGHKLPIWTKGDEIIIADQGPEGFIREEGCLDTWFSSALWPFATLGWPNDTPDLRKFYPASMIETADDILFFWCARMLMMGLLLTEQLPFSTIYLHGIMRDKDGKKMSKSLGNGIDPLTIIDKYGCDAMRFALAEANQPGQDMKMWEDKFQAGKATATKLWNAARFAEHHLRRISPQAMPSTHTRDLALLGLLRERQEHIRALYGSLEFSKAAQECRRLLFDDFCGSYLEDIKERLYADDTEALATFMDGLRILLQLFHPIMPFITESIWGRFFPGMLISQRW